MRKKDAVRYFGRKRYLAQALHVTDSAVTQWGDIIPEKQARRLEKITGGILKVRESDYVRLKGRDDPVELKVRRKDGDI